MAIFDCPILHQLLDRDIRNYVHSERSRHAKRSSSTVRLCFVGIVALANLANLNWHEAFLVRCAPGCGWILRSVLKGYFACVIQWHNDTQRQSETSVSASSTRMQSALFASEQIAQFPFTNSQLWSQTQ